MDGKELIDISVIIGFKDWGLERLLLSVSALALAFGESSGEVIISDFGSSNGPEIEAAVTAAGARYHRTETDGSWSRSRAVNAGYAVANGRVLVATDADMLFSPRSMEIIAKTVMEDPNTAVVLQCRDLPSTHSSESLDPSSLDWRELETVSQLRPRWGMGGMFAATRDRVGLVGGYDNRMHTYGGEDLDFAQRVRRSGAPVVWIEDPNVRMYHIWHPATINTVDKSEEATAAVAANRAILKTDLTWKRNRDSGSWTLPYAPSVVSVVIRVHGSNSHKHLVLESLAKQQNTNHDVFVIHDSNDDCQALRPPETATTFHFIETTMSLESDLESVFSLTNSPYLLLMDERTILSEHAVSSIMNGHTSDIQGLWAPVRLFSLEEDKYVAPHTEVSSTTRISGPTTGQPSVVVVSSKISRHIGLRGARMIDVQRNILNDIEAYSGNIIFMPEYLGFGMKIQPLPTENQPHYEWASATRYSKIDSLWDRAPSDLEISFPQGVNEERFLAKLAPPGVYRTDVTVSVGRMEVFEVMRQILPDHSSWYLIEGTNGEFIHFEAEITNVSRIDLQTLEELDLDLSTTSALVNTVDLSGFLEPKEMSDIIVGMSFSVDIHTSPGDRLGVNAMAYGVGSIPGIFDTPEVSELILSTDATRTISSKNERAWIWLRRDIGQLSDNGFDRLIRILADSGIDVGFTAPARVEVFRNLMSGLNAEEFAQ